MMVMQSTPPAFYTPAYHQGTTSAAGIVQHDYNTRPSIVISPPPGNSSRDSISNPPERPRERKPATRVKVPSQFETVVKDADISEQAENIGNQDVITGKADEQQQQQQHHQPRSSRSSSLDDLLNNVEIVTNYTHRRARSHFSIPDVIVTSSEEEGEAVHFEVQVEPARRKSSFASQLGSLNSSSLPPDVASLRKDRPQSPSQSHSKTSSVGSKVGKKIKSKPKPLALHFTSMKTSQEATAASSILFSPTTPGTPYTPTTKDGGNKIEKRSRKSSFPSIFSKKDREAANTAALPSSPTIVQSTHQSSRPLSPSSEVGYFSMLASFTTSPTSSTATTPTSPFYADMPTSPSSITSFTKKELKVKAKEEKNLIKELERVNKMVKKHDEKAQRTAKLEKRGAEEEKAGSISAKQGKAKNVLRRLSVFRPFPSVIEAASSRKGVEPVEVDAAVAAAVRDLQRSVPSEEIISNPSTKEVATARKDSAESERGHSAWTTDQWADVPSPLDEHLPSLTSDVPVNPEDDAAAPSPPVAETDTPTKKRSTTTLQRKESTTHRALVKLEAEKAGRRRSTVGSTSGNAVHSHNVTSSSKRRSLLGNQFKLGLGFIEGAELGWEDAMDSPTTEKSNVSTLDEQVRPMLRDNRAEKDKRSTLLLGSLYKDLDEMELTFQRDIAAIERGGERNGKLDEVELQETATPSTIAASSQISCELFDESWTSSRASISSKSTTPSSPPSYVSNSSPNSPGQSNRKSRIDLRSFQFPSPSPLVLRTADSLKSGSMVPLQRTTSVPQQAQDDPQRMENWMSKSTSSPSQFF
ncbi:hypothetical protein CBS101457_005642 [Exobasidium rhododendri]|nr:hypothetical protein CBS101457_005642 [Exobasidium rhododendri]